MDKKIHKKSSRAGHVVWGTEPYLITIIKPLELEFDFLPPLGILVWQCAVANYH